MSGKIEPTPEMTGGAAPPAGSWVTGVFDFSWRRFGFNKFVTFRHFKPWTQRES